ncbi:S-layer homology domain-containing protein [Anaerobacillus sp. MEB173]|uniref:S-layer homology domain-containing protein n=1 Tax=Anaerobacillus sp. MEB173 TaxID=3383345 RepID=UPI003F8EF371
MVSFYKHELVNLGNGYLLKLYIDPQLTEFASEFNNGEIQEKQELERSVKNYVKEKFPNLKVNAVKIIAGTMLVSSLTFAGGIGNNAQAAVQDENNNTTNTNETVQQTKTNFTDVNADAYYAEAVNELTGTVVFGITDTTFMPGKVLTRAEAATFIARSLGIDDEADVTDPGFTDVTDKDAWYYKSVAALTERGIIEGYGGDNNAFKPNQPVTRGELAKMIALSSELDGEGNTIEFTDVDAKAWYAPYVAALAKNGITAGTSETTFSPKSNTKRGEAVTFIYRAMNPDKRVNISDTTPPPGDGDTIPPGNDGDGFNDAQFIYDVNVIEGEGNLSEKFSELNYEPFDELTDVQKTEVAKLFLLSKGDTEFVDIDGIKAGIDTAIANYNDLLGAVNAAADQAAMKLALEDIAEFFGVTVTDEMANSALHKKPTDGYTSVTGIIDILQADEGDGEAAATYGFNITGGEENIERRSLLNDAPTGEAPTELAEVTPFTVSISKLTEDAAFEGNVRISPVGADNIQLWAQDTAGNWYDINVVGWGPETGFPIDLSATTDIYVLVGEDAGDTVELTFNLIDVNDPTNIIATETKTINVVSPNPTT